MTTYKSLAFISQKKPTPLPPELVNDKLKYEVKEIQDSRLFQGKLQYLVKWKGYPQEERTWESEKNIDNAKEMVKKFHKNHPSAPKRIRATLQFRPYENFTEDKRKIFDWTRGKEEEVRNWRVRDENVEIIEDDKV